MSRIIVMVSAVVACAGLLLTGCKQPQRPTPAAAEVEATAASAVEGLTSVESSLIAGVKYDAAKKVLTVALTSGDAYEYAGVPQATYDGLMAAESKGSYFTSNIKEKFEANKL